MQKVVEILSDLPLVQQLSRAWQIAKAPLLMTGPTGGALAAILGALSSRRPMVVLCPDEGSARRLGQDLSLLTHGQGAWLPARDGVYHCVESVSREWEQARIGLLNDLLEGKVRVLTASVEALTAYTLPPAELRRRTLTFRVGQQLSRGELTQALLEGGYSRTEQVEGPGQFALRGDLCDVFGAGEEAPVRLEFFGDEIDAMGTFDVLTQRRTENVQSCRLLPACEALGDVKAVHAYLSRRLQQLEVKAPASPAYEELAKELACLEEGRPLTCLDKYPTLLWPTPATAVDYFPKGFGAVLVEYEQLSRRCEAADKEQAQTVTDLLEQGLLLPDNTRMGLTGTELLRRLEQGAPLCCQAFMGSLGQLRQEKLFSLRALPLASTDRADTLTDLASESLEAGDRVCFLASTPSREEGFARTFAEAGLKRVEILAGRLSEGFRLADAGLTVLCDGGNAAVKRKRKRAPENAGSRIERFTDLTVGDYVVHISHGVGRFEGVERLTAAGAVRDYVKLRYAGSDVLYVPCSQLDVLSRFAGAEAEHAKLNKLGGTDWAKTKARAKAAAKDISKELLALYAKRSAQAGFAFSPDGPWQREFEDRFEYEETEAQLRCIAEIKSDMERPVPMDRLLCGDVGFGKTEVALRAAFKCAAEGKQVAVLVPTTVLSWQHYQTFLSRLRDYPMNVELLSRFRTPAQQRESLERLRRGVSDIAVGTHRLLQKDVVFKDLGLVIVDEEQRFGVTHKERLKELCAGVDVLTLTATPIPRTLNTALSGIRDMSLLEEAPENRFPVTTYVCEYDASVLHEAVGRELRRGGQVFWLHNRVESIASVAARLQREFPEAGVAVGHGKMTEEELSRVWREMAEGEIDILVCTTIIEAGVDVPNANTLIIEDADRFGLAQLHQLRGRVGRSTRRASAYLTFRPGKSLTDIAEKRLNAMREYASFGAGFKIAMRDLELRGAGNLLGAEQSGFMESVGYELYFKLLEEAVAEAKGEEAPVSVEGCTVDLPLTAYLPDDYVPGETLRLELYKKIAALENADEADDLLDELTDRFGQPPACVLTLIDIALIRSLASRCRICEISRKNGAVQCFVEEGDLPAVARLAGLSQGRMLVNAGSKPYFALRGNPDAEELTGLLRELLTKLLALRREMAAPKA